MSVNLITKTHNTANLSAEVRLKLMMELARKISSSLDLDSVLGLIIDTVHSFIHYDSAGIYIIERQQYQRVIVAHTSRGYNDELNHCMQVKVGDGIVGWAVKTGNGLIVPDVSSDPRYISARASTRSEMVAPIRANGKIIGAFNLECDHLDAYTKHDLELLMFFANEAAISIEKAMLHEALIEKKRLEAELAVAHRVQQSLLPKSDPLFGHFEIAGCNQPTEEVGGDYFDYIQIDNDRLGIAIADVAGKGVPAALIMATFRASLRSQLCSECALADTFKRLNMVMRESNATDQFVTAFYIELQRNKYELACLNAGHNRPLLMHADGSYEFLDEANTVIGLFANQQYTEFKYQVQAGDMLVLYTDGITEASAQGEEFGNERLIEVVRRHRTLPAKQVVAAIYDEVHTFTNNSRLQDDCTVVVVKAM